MEQAFLSRTDWAAVEAFLSMAGQVPADKQRFLARYGPFENEVAVEEFTGALSEIEQMASELGGPERLKHRLAKDGEYLLHSNPPDDVYASIVWISMQAGNIAQSMVSTLELLPQVMDSAGDRAQRAKQVLAGDGGITAKVEAMARTVRQVADKAAAYVPRLTASIVALQRSEVINLANRAISEMKADRKELAEQAAAASEKTKGWFGADKAKKEYESLQVQIADLDAEMARKQLLETDLGEEFFVAANKVAPSLSKVVEGLKELAKTFQGTADRIGDTFRLADKAQLGDAAWLGRALSVPAEIERWKALRTAAQSFTQGGLVAAG